MFILQFLVPLGDFALIGWIFETILSCVTVLIACSINVITLVPFLQLETILCNMPFLLAIIAGSGFARESRKFCAFLFLFIIS